VVSHRTRAYGTLYYVDLRKRRRGIIPVAEPKSDASKKRVIIAIDGPAGAGKSTVAARLADRLGLPYLDTGAMYRAVALIALREGLTPDLDDRAAQRVAEMMAERSIDVSADHGGTKILVDGEDVSGQIRSPECSMMASAVSALAAVRNALVPLQRKLGMEHGGVMEGRDIGTVVFPDADLKIFLTASAEERARRRYQDLLERNSETSLEEVQNDQNRRDRQDTSRAESPLQVARGSVVVDTTGMTLEEVVDRLYEDVAGLLPTVLDSPDEKP
jgi:cytidylate kinase